MKAMTTAYIVKCPHIPMTGLKPEMHNPTLPLSMIDILDSPGVCGGDEKGPAITIALLYDAVCRVHGNSVMKLYQDTGRSPPSIPVFEKLPPHKTEFWQLGAIFEDEGTISGTYGVHNAIFLKQFGLKAPETPLGQEKDDFRDRLWIVHGDQLTAHHVRAVKSAQFRAARPYDRRDWMLCVPSWFHMQMALQNTVVRTHFSADTGSNGTRHCITADATTWGRTIGDRASPKYHILDPLLAQGFTARILAMFYDILERRGFLDLATDIDGKDKEAGSFEKPEHFDRAIQLLEPNDFEEVLEEIRQTAFTLEAWDGEGHADTEFKTMCRMLQEVELFLTVRHAVKHADIGLLRRLVDPMIMVFLGASQWNYAYEMMWYRWNLSPVNTPELQRAILASGIVNWQGRLNKNKPIDLGLEHLNGNVKNEMKCYKNSTHDEEIIFGRVCLTNTIVRTLRSKFERVFGEDMTEKHSTASALQDMFSLARIIFTGGLASPRRGLALNGQRGVFESEDIFKLGAELLAEKVEYFNRTYTRQSALREGLYSEGVADTGEVDVTASQIEAYTTYADERTDINEDPTVDIGPNLGDVQVPGAD